MRKSGVKFTGWISFHVTDYDLGDVEDGESATSWFVKHEFADMVHAHTGHDHDDFDVDVESDNRHDYCYGAQPDNKADLR